MPVLALARADIESGAGLRAAALRRLPTVDWGAGDGPGALARCRERLEWMVARHPRALGPAEYGGAGRVEALRAARGAGAPGGHDPAGVSAIISAWP